MPTQRRFVPTDTMIELVKEDYNIIPVLSRFAIPLGFGDQTIAAVCGETGISVDVFLLVINFIMSGNIDKELMSAVKPVEIVDFLHRSHAYFLTYKFPHIRGNLLKALDDNHSDINPIIVRFYDDFIRHVEHHFDYEERIVFPYIRDLDTPKKYDYNISIFRQQHDEVGETLRELKNIILRYYTTGKPDVMYDVLVDIYNVEDDLNSHSEIENNILVPMVRAVERRINSRKR